jgi:hypothetical protein
MASRRGTLTTLQCDALDAVTRHAPGFFLTGGAVLAGWTLKHRATDDLDLFTTSDEDMAIASVAVRGAATEIGAVASSVTTAPDFHRYLITRSDGAVRVDLVRDRTPELRSKVVRDGIRMDDTEEIIANKIAALVGRSEIRDVVDLMALEKLGFRVEDHLGGARKKDGGVSPATLSWLLSSIHAPARVDGAEQVDLEAFIRDLERRMLALSTPR